MQQKMRFIPLLIALGLLIFALPGCRDKKTVAHTPKHAPVSRKAAPAPSAILTPISGPNYKVVPSAKGYIVEIPKSWRPQTLPPSMIDRAFARPRAAGSLKFIENVTIVVEELGQSISPEEYYRANLTMMKKSLTKFQQLSAVPFRGHQAGERLDYTWEAKGQPLKVTTFFFVKGARGYAVTCTATPTTYAQYAARFEQIGKSFRWSK